MYGKLSTDPYNEGSSARMTSSAMPHHADPEVIRAVNAAACACLPGVATPEGFAALRAEADRLKLFAAEAARGVSQRNPAGADGWDQPREYGCLCRCQR
jgi:hypothetical protein